MHYDAIILGAGGAGLFCAFQAAERGRKILVLDHGTKLGGKILISGGGRCNFTNLDAGPANYVSQNPHFCKSALSRYTPKDFIQLVEKHGIPYHEKTLGQLFCDRSAQDIVDLLSKECHRLGVHIILETEILSVDSLPANQAPNRFAIKTSRESYDTPSVVVATGGLSIPKLRASGLGYSIARKFGLEVVPTVPALDGFVFLPGEEELFTPLAGVSLDAVVETGGMKFRENILFTHTGLSGPAALQASLHWNKGQTVQVNAWPKGDLAQWLIEQKLSGSQALIKNVLALQLPARFAEVFCTFIFEDSSPLSQISNAKLEALAAKIQNWTFVPERTVGYQKAEVTRGGVDTHELSSKTLESKKVPGLYFVGEVVDVTGWLGGYNFQWAWSSGWAAAQSL